MSLADCADAYSARLPILTSAAPCICWDATAYCGRGRSGTLQQAVRAGLEWRTADPGCSPRCPTTAASWHPVPSQFKYKNLI